MNQCFGGFAWMNYKRGASAGQWRGRIRGVCENWASKPQAIWCLDNNGHV